MEDKKVKHVYCHNCKCETDQEIIFNDSTLDINEIIGYNEEGVKGQNFFAIVAHIYEVTKCCGCKKNNINVYERTNPMEKDRALLRYPNTKVREYPKWLSNLNLKYIELFNEIYKSFNTGNITLPLIGARTLLDMYIVEKIGDIGTFKNKIDKLLENGLITKVQKDFLSIALEYGNAAAHRGYKAEIDEVNKVLDIIETLFREEALKLETSSLKKTIPRKDTNQGTNK